MSIKKQMIEALKHSIEKTEADIVEYSQPCEKSLAQNRTAHRVEQWAKERGLDNPDNSTAQALKLFEEAGELAQAHLKEREQDGKDAVGDILVVLTIYCQQKGWSIAECFELAYNEIKNRKGKMVNGSFVKSEDLR